MAPLFQILIAIAVIVVAAYFLTAGSKPKVGPSNDFLIYGIPDSQKTRIFYKLVTGKETETTTSFSPNRVQIETDGTVYTLVDFPGSSSYDKELRSALKPGSNILFPIDSTKKFS